MLDMSHSSSSHSPSSPTPSSNPTNWKSKAKRAWKFFWHDDSLASWLANMVVAFLVIYFIVYPVLGSALGTSFPIVAVLSESMQHNIHDENLCGQSMDRSTWKDSFDNYWDLCGYWYEQRNITKEQFTDFPLKNGFNKGDVIILYKPNNIQVGDVLIFQGNRPQPIIHRVVKVWQEDSNTYYQTKGDHNGDSITGALGESKISKDRLLGKGVIRLPYLGWVKILFVEFMSLFGIQITR